jgi:hypothetical protein
MTPTSTLAAVNLTAMSESLRVVLERDGEHAALEVFPPNSMTSVYCVWWLHNTKDQRIVKMSASARRTVKWFNKRVAKLERAGWVVKGGEAVTLTHDAVA